MLSFSLLLICLTHLKHLRCLSSNVCLHWKRHALWHADTSRTASSIKSKWNVVLSPFSWLKEEKHDCRRTLKRSCIVTRKKSADVLHGRREADWPLYTAAAGLSNYYTWHWHQMKRKLIFEWFCTDCMQPTQQDMDINVCNPDTDVFFCFAVTLSRYITDCLWTLKLVLTNTC